MSALGKPKSTTLAAIRKRWENTIKTRRDVTWGYHYSVQKPTAWHQVLTGEPLPSAEQAALDIDALLELVTRMEQDLAMHSNKVKLFDELTLLVGGYCDNGSW